MFVLKLITLPVFLLLSAIAAYIFFDNKIDSLTRRVTRCKHCKSEKINYLHWPVERKSGGGETLKYDWKEIKKKYPNNPEMLFMSEREWTSTWFVYSAQCASCGIELYSEEMMNPPKKTDMIGNCIKKEAFVKKVTMLLKIIRAIFMAAFALVILVSIFLIIDIVSPFTNI